LDYYGIENTKAFRGMLAGPGGQGQDPRNHKGRENIQTRAMSKQRRMPSSEK